MLWRTSYHTRELPLPAQVELPKTPQQDFVLVVSFSPRAIQQREVWRKLCAAELNRPYFLCCAGGEPALKAIRSIIPPSQESEWLPFEGADWRLWAQPSEDQAIAAVIAHDNIKLAMIGPPTEEAWERFCSVAQTQIPA